MYIALQYAASFHCLAEVLVIEGWAWRRRQEFSSQVFLRQYTLQGQPPSRYCRVSTTTNHNHHSRNNIHNHYHCNNNPQPTTNNQEPRTNNQQPITNRRSTPSVAAHARFLCEKLQLSTSCILMALDPHGGGGSGGCVRCSGTDGRPWRWSWRCLAHSQCGARRHEQRPTGQKPASSGTDPSSSICTMMSSAERGPTVSLASDRKGPAPRPGAGHRSLRRCSGLHMVEQLVGPPPQMAEYLVEGSTSLATCQVVALPGQCLEEEETGERQASDEQETGTVRFLLLHATTVTITISDECRSRRDS